MYKSLTWLELSPLLCHMYKINPSLCSACFLLCSAQVFTAWTGASPKRALSIICPSLSYDEALNEAGIPTIISYCEDICDKVFNTALGNKDNKLNKLLTEANKAPYLLRNHVFQSGRQTVLRTVLFCHRA